MVSYELLSRTRNFRERHHITESGQGAGTVVLANGFGTTQTIWHKILPWLEARYRVVRFDWALEPVDYDTARYADITGFVDDLLAVISATGAAPCRLISHSVSGMVGMLAAKGQPNFFERMVMLAPSPRYINDPGYHGGMEQADVDALLEQMADDYVAWAQDFSPRAVAGTPDQPEVQEFMRGLLAMRPDEAFAMALAIFNMDLRGQLDGFTVPTTIVQTREDIAVPAAVGQYLHERWPGSRLEIIEAAGHFPHLTASDQLIAILEENWG